MELMTLNSNFQPENPVENYESLIWSERYSKNGDFELNTTDIAATLQLLPRETCIALRESTVPMLVEDFLIEKPKGQPPTLKVTGRSFETVLERRAAANSLPAAAARATWTMLATKASDAAYKAVQTVLGGAVSPLDAIPQIQLITPADFTPDAAAWNSATNYAVGALVTYTSTLWRAKVTNTNVAPAVGATWEALPSYEITPGDLYTTVLELINTNYHGIKAIRPVLGGTKVGIEIYNGADLSSQVVFDARFDQFDSAKYLLSERGSANVAYMYGSNGSQTVLKNTGAEPSGLNRRVLMIDQTNEAGTNTTDVRRIRALIELYKYNATALFDGEVAEQVAAGYNTTYHLGDVVKLVGEYSGISQNVRVAEFIRTSDASGDKAYPAFESIA